MKLTLAELRRRVGGDENAAYILLEELRWPNAKLVPERNNVYVGVDCPTVGTSGLLPHAEG